MGLLKEGKILPWKESKLIQDKIKSYSIQECIQLYHCYKDHTNMNDFKWGYEIEYMLYISYINEFKIGYQLAQTADQILKTMPNSSSWHPEYLSSMLENIPENPLSWKELDNIYTIIDSHRQYIIDTYDTLPFAVSTDMLLGIHSLETPSTLAKSTRLDDSYIYPHDRFYNLTKTIVERRGKPISIILPVLKDLNTEITKIELDAMGFGMGCCCLQSTYGMSSLPEALYIYDQLTVLSPLLLAISASTPICSGHLLETDTRISILEQSVDCRKEEEYDKINYSRFYWNQLYLSDKANILNDIHVQMDESYLATLINNKIPESFAKYIASLHVHDCLLVYDDQWDTIKQTMDSALKGEMFTNILSSNWTNVRLKPPLDNESWKVELRCLDIQRNSYENSAFLVFVTVLVKTLIHFKLDLRIPMSYLHINIKQAQKIDAVKQNRFYYNVDGKVRQGKLSDIFQSNRDRKGILTYMHEYLDLIGSSDKIMEYIQFMTKKITGEIDTDAQIIREFVFNHKEYRNDSKITKNIADDLITEYYNIE